MLALALIARSTPMWPILLVGDDRVLVSRAGDRLYVAPHPRIAGLIERRGTGILSLPYCDHAPIGGLVDLGEPQTGRLLDIDIEHLAVDPTLCWDARPAHVLSWFAETNVPHSFVNEQRQPWPDRKDYNW
jgi:hypothetical protein